MTQEDKGLLLKDICARLPYGLIIQVSDWTPLDTELKVGHISRLMNEDLKIKPYLRPMSSMTDEERVERISILLELEGHIDEDVTYKYQDWLNAHYFDYRGLIKKGLAIEVTDENNPYKEA